MQTIYNNIITRKKTKPLSYFFVDIFRTVPAGYVAGSIFSTQTNDSNEVSATYIYTLIESSAHGKIATFQAGVSNMRGAGCGHLQ